MRLEEDKRGKVVQSFFINGGITLTSTYTPLDDLLLTPTAITNISIDGVTVNYQVGSIFGLRKGKTYTISGNFTFHKA